MSHDEQAATPDFRSVFDAMPGINLLLAADPPRYTMLAASDDRLAATLTSREGTIGKPLFEVFSDANPENSEPSGQSNLRASLETVIRTREPHTMAVQRYDIRRPDDSWEERYWAPRNVPILGRDGAVLYILHQVEDVTETVRRTLAHERLRVEYAESEDARRELERANQLLKHQQAALEEVNAQLTEQSMELELQTEDLGVASRVLEERTAEAERARVALAASAARLEFLANASERLAASLDYETTLREVLALAVPAIAEWALYTVDGGDGTVRIVISRHATGEHERLVAEIAQRYPISMDEPAGAAKVLRTGEPELIREVPDAVLEAVARDDRHLELLRAVGFRSLMTVPVIGGGRTLGALGFVTGRSGRLYGADDLTLAQELARRAGTAIDNARLYAEATAARQEAEAQRARVAESEHQFRTLADAIPTLAWTARADGAIEWYNARWYEYTGTTPEQMEGWGWQSVHDPELLPDVLARWNASLATGSPFEMTFPLRGADGRFRRFLSRVVPVHGADGQVLQWFGTNTDVEIERAAREEAEHAAARTALLQSWTDALSSTLTREDVAVAVLDRLASSLGAHLGVLALVTPDGQRLAVGAMDRLRDEPWQEWRSFPIDAPVPLASAARTGQPVVLSSFADIERHAPSIAELCREYGTESMYVVPVVASEGRVLGSIGLSFHTARQYDAETRMLLNTLARQAAQAVERAELFEAAQSARAAAEAAEIRLRDVFEQAPVAVAVLSGPDHVYEVVSPPYAASPGAGRQLLGRSVRDAFPEIAQTDYIDTMDRVYRTGEPYSAKERQVFLAGPDGALVEHFFNIGYQPLRDATGNVYAIASVAYDVTEQVQARQQVEAAREEAERQRAEAEAANRAKSEFLAVMSHELRTPLNAIGGYAELIELGIHGPVTDAQRTALDRIQRSQRHLLGLISGVLDYSRVEAGAVSYHLVDVLVTDAVAEAEALVAPQLRAKGLGYSWSGAPAGLSVRADREKLQQILLNLLGNAVKFTNPRDGSPGRIEVACTLDDGRAGSAPRVHIHVTDTGEGIAPEALERVFEPFVQADQRLTRPHAGVGLGLAISRDLARGMGGDLTVTSTLGQGSRFTLTLPLARFS